MRQRNASKLFQWSDSPLKNTTVKIVKITRVIHSWSTLSCMRENGPPLPANPMRLAGTRHEYSARAMPHERRMTKNSGVLLVISFMSCSLRCPYHAKVMKIFEMTSRITVKIAFFILLIEKHGHSVKYGGARAYCSMGFSYSKEPILR